MSRLDAPYDGRVFVDGAEVGTQAPSEPTAYIAPDTERDEAGLLRPMMAYTNTDIENVKALFDRREVAPAEEESDLVPSEVDEGTEPDAQPPTIHTQGGWAGTPDRHRRS